MNTKGFTLVELIAVIVILSLLALITSTAVTKLVSDAKNDLSETQITLIKSAAETWMADNLTYLPDTGECSYLTLEDLKNYGLLDSNVLDPKNNQEISDDLKIKISTTLSKYGNPVRNVEVNPKNIDGCNKIYELINQKIVNEYASAIKDAIRKHQLNGNSIIPGSYTSSEDGKTLSKEGVEPPITVDYDKNVYCEIIEIYNDETIYLANCTVNGTAVDYTYGEQQITQVYKPQYYGDWSGTVGTTAAPSNPSSVAPTDKNYYLGYDVEDGKVSAAYVCFKREGNDTEYCLKGYDTEAYATNTEVLEEAFGASACSFDVGYFNCSSAGLRAGAYSNGGVYASGGSARCYVNVSGYFGCTE